MSTWPRRLLIGFALLVLLLMIAFQLAVRTLRAQVEGALGPHGEVARIELGLRAVVLHDLKIRADREGKAPWPAEDELRARRVEVVPQLRDLLSARVRIARIEVEGGYLSMLRTRDGALRVLPALLDRSGTQVIQDEAPGALPEILIDRIELRDSSVDFFDASVRRMPHRLALEKVTADVGPIDLPKLEGRVAVSITAALPGPRTDGELSLTGDIVPATRNARLDLALSQVDVRVFQPYLIQATETGVKRGTLKLDLKATVSDNFLKAPGKLTLTSLELSSGNTFMGMPRAAVIGLLKDRNQRISVDFTLQGRLDDPAFSLNEGFSTRVATSVAESLGVSLGGLVRGVGSAGSSVAKGVGEAVGKLFGN
jgi:hypothetical protein